LLPFAITSAASFRPSERGSSDDQRNLAFHLDAVYREWPRA
jgi:hypothetical protein